MGRRAGLNREHPGRGGTELYDALAETRQVATRGTYFDTGSEN